MDTTVFIFIQIMIRIADHLSKGQLFNHLNTKHVHNSDQDPIF